MSNDDRNKSSQLKSASKGPMGVVLEIEGNRAVVLGQNGQFLRLKLSSTVSIGDYVPMPASTPISSYRKKRQNTFRVRTLVAGIAAAVVLVVGVFHAALTSPVQAKAYAFVSLDLNPSISLDLDKHMKVIGVHALNSAGNAVVKSVSVNGLPMNQAINALVSDVEKSNTASDAIIVTASAPSNTVDVSSIQTMATSDVTAALSKTPKLANGHSPTVYGLSISDAVWNAASKNKVSPGTYATYLLAQQAGIPVQLKDISSTDVQMVLTQVHDLQAGVKQLNNHSGDANYQNVQQLVEQAVGN